MEIAFPRARVPDAAETEMPRPFNVLIVEDHDPLRQILIELMRERGWQAFATEHVQEAFDFVATTRPDFGLLDLHLPGSNGLELFRRIAREIGPLPAIMMSGEATSSETDAALSAGVFTFLRKPIAMQHLQRSLNLLIEHHFPPPPEARPRAPGS